MRNHLGPVVTCRIQQNTGQCSHNRYCKLEKIEAVVIGMVRELLNDPIAATKFAENFVQARRKENSEIGRRRKQAHAALNKAKAAKERVVSLGIRGILDLDAVEAQARALIAEIAECEATWPERQMRLISTITPQAAAIYGRAVEKLAELFSSDQMEKAGWNCASSSKRW